MKTLVLTGASGLIGHQIAKVHLQDGWKVIGLDQKDPVIDEENFQHIDCDVGCEEEVESGLKSFESIEGLVNCVADTEKFGTPIAKLSVLDWEKGLRTNLTSYFILTKICLDRLKKAKGSIVNIASTRATMSEKNTEIYSASKGAIVSLTHALAISLGPEVRVNCISPGWIDKATKEHSKQDNGFHPSGRVGCPDDVAELCHYLTSDKAVFLNGQDLVIDGGVTKKMIYPQ